MGMEKGEEFVERDVCEDEGVYGQQHSHVMI